jgi:hypothetical protein
MHLTTDRCCLSPHYATTTTTQLPCETTGLQSTKSDDLRPVFFIDPYVDVYSSGTGPQTPWEPACRAAAKGLHQLQLQHRTRLGRGCLTRTRRMYMTCEVQRAQPSAALLLSKLCTCSSLPHYQICASSASCLVPQTMRQQLLVSFHSNTNGALDVVLTQNCRPAATPDCASVHAIFAATTLGSLLAKANLAQPA